MYSFLGALITKLLNASLNQWRVCFLACVTTPTQTEHFTHEMQVLLHSQTRDGVRQWVAEDGLGSVRMMTDVSGVITETRNYAPYGSVLSQSGTSQTVYGFAGEQMDDSGLSYNRARYYNPALGAFTALDPFEGLEERPMSINGYSYAENNPANWTDPSGKFVNLAFTLGATVLGGIVGGLSSYFFANQLFDMAKNGECGCQRKEWAYSMLMSGQKQNYLNTVTRIGAMSGAAFGALATIPGSAAIISKLGIGLGTLGAGASVLDMIMNQLNRCNALEFLLSIAGILGSVASGGTTISATIGGGRPPTGVVPVLATAGGGSVTSSATSATTVTAGVSAIPATGASIGSATSLGGFVFSSGGNSGNPLHKDEENRADTIQNSRGESYPEYLDARTGKRIPFPDGNPTRVARSSRVHWSKQQRGNFIRQWIENNYQEIDWSRYDIHHILPREFGGTNDFWNLVPVERGFHPNFTTWWRNYTS
jgi:RHS repeat-associated protein